MTNTTIHGNAPVAHPDRFFIGGDWVVPSSSSTIDVITPSTEELFLTVAEARQKDVERAVAAARDAFDKGPWPRMRHAERATYLREIAKRVSARAASLANIWTSEVGVIATLSATIGGVGSVYDYYASLADTFSFEERHVPQAGGNVGLLVREPVGVVAAIIPWNGPLVLIAYKVAPALLAGCTGLRDGGDNGGNRAAKGCFQHPDRGSRSVRISREASRHRQGYIYRLKHGREKDRVDLW
jgi:aldehyde dehydrogenase (NAD+)